MGLVPIKNFYKNDNKKNFFENCNKVHNMMIENSEFQTRLTNVIKDLMTDVREAISAICLPTKVDDAACLAQALIQYDVVGDDDDAKALIGDFFGYGGLLAPLKLSGKPGKFRIHGFSPEQEVLFRYLAPFFQNIWDDTINAIVLISHLNCPKEKFIVLKTLIAKGIVKDKTTASALLRKHQQGSAASTIERSNLNELMRQAAQGENEQEIMRQENERQARVKAEEEARQREEMRLWKEREAQEQAERQIRDQELLRAYQERQAQDRARAQLWLQQPAQQQVHLIGLPPPPRDFNDRTRNEVTNFFNDDRLDLIGPDDYLEICVVQKCSSTGSQMLIGECVNSNGWFSANFWRFVKRFRLLEKVKEIYGGSRPDIRRLTYADISLRGDGELGALEEVFVNLTRDQIEKFAKNPLKCFPPKFGITIYAKLLSRYSDNQIRDMI